MESNEGPPTRARDAGNDSEKVETVGELARRLPEAHKVIERLHLTWKALVSRTTPPWKKVLVALETVRLSWEARRRRKQELEAVRRNE